MNLNWKRLALAPILLAVGVSLGGCPGDDDKGTTQEATDVDRQQTQYVNNQPIPFFDWSLERHLLIELYKARNNAVRTYSYVRNQYTGKIMSWCPSIGYPVPANTQLTNPHRIPASDAYQGGHVLDQAEPNGTFTSPSTRGTYVMCVDADGKVVPRYHEEDVEAFLTPMVEKDGELVPVEGSVPSITIDPRKP